MHVPCAACGKLIPVRADFTFDECGRCVIIVECSTCEKTMCAEIEVYEFPSECKVNGGR